MKTVTNKTHTPLQIPLPGGKVLRLGPGMSGQIRDEAANHGPLRKLVEGGQIEVQGGAGGGGTTVSGKGGILPGADGRGHGPTSVRQNRGDK